MRKILCRFFHWCLLMLEDPREQAGCLSVWAPMSRPPEARTLARHGSRVLVGTGSLVLLYDMETREWVAPQPDPLGPMR